VVVPIDGCNGRDADAGRVVDLVGLGADVRADMA
jgi:hypothetical protein